MTTPGPPWNWPAHVMAEEIRARRITALEVLDAHLGRIRAHNGRLNAMVLVDEDGARAAAIRVDERIARGQAAGPLAGVPFCVKDALDTAGLRTTAGVALHAQRVPTRDAPAVQRMKRAGAVLVGKSNLPPWCADIQVQGELFGRTSNPWDVTRTSGGSSGGGAAAVASGLVAVEIGSDHGGSLRIPAAFCGVVGMKVTEGVVPTSGHMHPFPLEGDTPPPIITVGPITRTVEDAARVTRVLVKGGGNPGVEAPTWTAVVPRRTRVAWVPRVDGLVIDGDVRDVVDVARDRVPGVMVDVPAAAWRDAWSAWSVLIRHATAGEPLRWLRALAAPRGSGASREEQQARAVQSRWRARLDAWLEKHDVVALPTTLVPAFPHAPINTPVVASAGALDYWLAAAATTCVASLTGHPAITLPAGLARGRLPVGLMLMGRRGADARLLAHARVIAERLPGVLVPVEPR